MGIRVTIQIQCSVMLKVFVSFQVCFSDEYTLTICEESSQNVRISEHEEFSEAFIAETEKHPTSDMVWSIISAKGTGHLYVVKV